MTTTIRLRYDDTATDVRGVASLVFGHLMKLALPVITAYHSDLYHDALWLDKYLAGASFTFYWAVRETGTQIGTDESLFLNWIAAYRLTVILDRGSTTLTVTP